MDRSGKPHIEAELSTARADDAISGLYTIVPNIRTRRKAEFASDPTRNLDIVDAVSSYLTIAAALIALTAAVTTLAGWALDIGALRTVFEGFAPMKPNTAIGVMLCASALLIMSDGSPRVIRRFSVIGRICAGIAAAIGILTLAEFASGFDLGIDRLLFYDRVAQTGMGFGGQMSPATAFCLALSGLSIFLLDRRWGSFRPSTIFAVAVLLTSMLSFLGYIVNEASLYSIGAFRSVAVHTVISFFALSLGTLLARKDSAINRAISYPGASGILLRRLAPAALLAPLVIGWLRLEGQRAGLYDADFGLALFAAAITAVFGFLVWRSAAAIGRSSVELHELDVRLARQREHLDLAFDAGEIGGWDLDLASLNFRRTSRFDRILGVDDSPSMALADLVERIHPDDRSAFLRSFEEGKKENVFHPQEVRIVQPGGEVRDVWLQGRVMIDETTSQEHIVGIILDVTSRKRAEAERREVFERITDAFVAVDNDFDFTYVNTKAAAMLARDRDQLIGRNMWEEFPEGLKTGFRRAYSDAIENQDAVVHEEFFEPLGIWIEVRVFPSAEGLSIYFHDVSERKQAEKEIRDLNEMLELRVAERTSELENVNRELESFAYSVSHDLRAPLRAIDGFSAAVVEDFGDKLDAEGRSYLDRVRRASRHMGQLIDDLLKLSRVSRVEMRRDEVDLSAMAGRVIQGHRESEPLRAVEAVVEPGMSVLADGILLRSVLENLIGNAWKFTSKTEGPRIEIGSTERNGEKMYFVKDNGAGFDMAYRDKLFGAFQRLHNPRDFEGTGIGLATVQRIVNRHGGTVDAEGSPGGGATFYFSLGGEKNGKW